MDTPLYYILQLCKNVNTPMSIFLHNSKTCPTFDVTVAAHFNTIGEAMITANDISRKFYGVYFKAIPIYKEIQ